MRHVSISYIQHCHVYGPTNDDFKASLEQAKLRLYRIAPALEYGQTLSCKLFAELQRPRRNELPLRIVLLQGSLY
jgi:hypothetical protein